MGNEFNGMKFDYWTDYKDDSRTTFVYGVWNNNMKARQYISEWDGTKAPSKEEAINMARSLNSKYNENT